MSKEAMKLALDKVQEFKSRWCKVPPFADRVNKATREAITLAQVPIFELEHVLQKALAEQPAQTDWEAVAADQALTIALLKSEQPAPVAEPHKQQEPYGWKVDGYIDLLFGANAENEAKASAKEINSVAFPLYTSPQPAQPSQSRSDVKPLTDEQIEEVWRRVQAEDFHDCVQPLARAIEAAHGITGD